MINEKHNTIHWLADANYYIVSFAICQAYFLRISVTVFSVIDLTAIWRYHIVILRVIRCCIFIIIVVEYY